MTDTITPESLRALARYDIIDPNHVNLPAEARDALRAAADEIERLTAMIDWCEPFDEQQGTSTITLAPDQEPIIAKVRGHD